MPFKHLRAWDGGWQLAILIEIVSKSSFEEQLEEALIHRLPRACDADNTAMFWLVELTDLYLVPANEANRLSQDSEVPGHDSIEQLLGGGSIEEDDFCGRGVILFDGRVDECCRHLSNSSN